MKLKKISIAALTVAIPLALTACGVGEAKIASEDEQAAATPLPVEVVSPTKSDIYATYHTTTNNLFN